MSQSKLSRVRVWDLPTRLFHWLLVGLMFCAWASFEFSGVVGDTTMLWHRWNGYAILVLVIWRVLWGIVGSPASKFQHFLVWPWHAARYGLDLIRGRERHYLGHNPLGSYMIVALLLLVGAQGTLGLFATEHNFVAWGPLSNLVDGETTEALTKWHAWMFENVILIFIGAHVAANVLHRLVKKDQLIEAMVIGSKPPADYEDQHVALDGPALDGRTLDGRGLGAEVEASSGASELHQPRRPLARAGVCLALAIAIFFGTVIALGGKFSG